MRAKLKTFPAPVGGWNARDSLADMDETDAVILDNWFPSEGKVELRKGYTEHCTGLGGYVKTLAEFHNGATNKLIAAANGKLWDVSTPTAAELATGFSEDAWQHVNFDGKLGLVNGTDAPQVYDGSTMSAMTVSGVTGSDLIGVNVFKGRTFFWQENSQKFWYSNINTLGGSLTEFPLNRVGQFGGKLMVMTTWSRDGGDGPDDLAVFIMSSGEVIVYQGSDPGADWALVGVYRIGAPIGRRCVVQFGGDVVVITKDGYISLNEVLGSGRTRRQSVGGKIARAVRERAVLSADDPGWQPIFFPAGSMVIFNVPKAANSFEQHVVNTLTGAWCRFTEIDAQCWSLFADELYFGGNGVVYQAWNGYADDGEPIRTDGIPAYQYFTSPAQIKQFTAVQLNLVVQTSLELAIRLVTDFNNGVRAQPNASLAIAGTPWGSPWGSSWATGETNYNPWKTVTSAGRSASIRFAINSQNQAVYWYATTYAYKTGGAL